MHWLYVREMLLNWQFLETEGSVIIRNWICSIRQQLILGYCWSFINMWSAATFLFGKPPCGFQFSSLCWLHQCRVPKVILLMETFWENSETKANVDTYKLSTDPCLPGDVCKAECYDKELDPKGATYKGCVDTTTSGRTCQVPVQRVWQIQYFARPGHPLPLILLIPLRGLRLRRITVAIRMNMMEDHGKGLSPYYVSQIWRFSSTICQPLSATLSPLPASDVMCGQPLKVTSESHRLTFHFRCYTTDPEKEWEFCVVPICAAGNSMENLKVNIARGTTDPGYSN